jgi:hypothetical protein
MKWHGSQFGRLKRERERESNERATREQQEGNKRATREQRESNKRATREQQMSNERATREQRERESGNGTETTSRSDTETNIKNCVVMSPTY